MRLIGVCGGRDFADVGLVNKALHKHTVGGDVIVHGDAWGADKLADGWAESHGHSVIRVPAIWKRHGRGAGPRRNAVIAALPLAKLIAFPGGAGTADMVERARQSNITVIEIEKVES